MKNQTVQITEMTKQLLEMTLPLVGNDTTIIGNDTTIIGNDITAVTDESEVDNINSTVIEVPLSEQGDKDPVEPTQSYNDQGDGQTDNTMGSEVVKNVENSPALPAKGSYNLDFDNLDSINPFATKSAVVNSPGNVNNNNINSLQENVTAVQVSDTSESLRQHNADVSVPAVSVKPSDQDSDSETEFQDALSDVENDSASKNVKVKVTASETLNKPKGLSDRVSDLQSEKDTLNDLTGSQMAEDLLSENFDDIDPFKPGFIIPNSPLRQNLNLYDDGNLESELGCGNQHNETNKLIHDEGVKLPKEEDIPKPPQQITKLSEKLDEIDPFKTKQIVNSPDTLEDVDPFKPSKQIVNSPDKQDEIDPFKPSKQIVNSPNKQEEIEPLKPSKEIVNSPDKQEVIDPFKPSKQIVNSPDKQEEIDPFKPSKQIVNSPGKQEEIDPFKPSKQIVNSPDKQDEIDPFKPSKQIVNSPDKQEEIDPFKPSKQIVNSPDRQQEIDPFKPSKQIVNSPGKQEEIDPFKPSKQIVNSPGKQEEIDPFKPSKQIVNSPDKQDEIDPFKPSKQIVNSPDKQDEIDPFKPSKQIVNSPDKKTEYETDTEPFKPVKEEKNSPNVKNEGITKHGESNNSVEQTPEGQEMSVFDENLDPFQSNNKVMNSPSLTGSENPFVTQSKVANSPDIKAELLQNKDSDSEVKSSSGQSVNDVNNKENVGLDKTPDDAIPAAIDQGFEVEEDQFKPATDMFNSPSAWDMLEKFGSGSSTGMDLARQSLYVKFDPLVNIPLHDPRRASIGLRRLSMGIRAGMKPEQQKDLNPEESFLLLGTPPNQRSRRITSHGVRPCTLVEEGTPNSKQASTAPIDLLFASPAAKTVQENENQGSNSNVMLPNEQSDSDIIQVLQYTEMDMQNLKDAMNLWYQGMLMNKEKEWSKSLSEKEKEKQVLIKKHEKEKQELMKKQKGTSTEYENLMMVVKEYEKMIQQFIDEKEKGKESTTKLKQERDQALEDVQSLENSFADLHKRYEKLRAAMEARRKNEELLKKCAEDFKNKLVKADEKILALKKDAESKLARAQQENEQLKADKEKDHAISETLIKRKDLQIDSLQKSYDQKVNEVTELTNLCEELMAKVQK
ncbi:hypothetical protein KUTeg_005277 [Tegillarca granosa]|uniref:Transforming acidic coiled-coil-containing protein C-terminal domain-containing protein n=1 Tax=Tegillarca granosa TaxID=220873 RepID=A0ABQ9FJ91_TEGGR|nr:hypothetical protein KUTeg_005277 [Tegillarca granosa]